MPKIIESVDGKTTLTLRDQVGGDLIEVNLRPGSKPLPEDGSVAKIKIDLLGLFDPEIVTRIIQLSAGRTVAEILNSFPSRRAMAAYFQITTDEAAELIDLFESNTDA